MDCRDCQAELDHCHEVLIVHADGWAECGGGPGCDGRVETHLWVVACAEVTPSPCCAPVGALELAA